MISAWPSGGAVARAWRGAVSGSLQQLVVPCFCQTALQLEQLKGGLFAGLFHGDVSS